MSTVELGFLQQSCFISPEVCFYGSRCCCSQTRPSFVAPVRAFQASDRSLGCTCSLLPTLHWGVGHCASLLVETVPPWVVLGEALTTAIGCM